jgi:carboxymethylenebutenolidase
MGEIERLTASDGHDFTAYRAGAGDGNRGRLVVVQEVFGVNAHIRDVCDRYAELGFEAIAPALFDRVRPGVELDYTAEDVAVGRQLAAEIGWDGPTLDLRAAAEALRPDGKVGLVGYCWGASWVWMAAAHNAPACAVCYYGRHVPAELLQERPTCPVLMHFGERDASIPPDQVERVRAAYPEIPVHVYPDADHGFNCDRRSQYHAESAKLALERTLAFFDDHRAS